MEKKYCVTSCNFSPTAGLVVLLYVDRILQILLSIFLISNWEITPEIIENIETFPYPHNSSTASATVLV